MGIGRVQNDMQARVQSFLEALSLLLLFSVQTKPKTPFHLIVSHSEQKTFQRWNTPSLFKLVWSSFFFCCLNCLFQVEVFEAIQHILTSRAWWQVPKRVDETRKNLISKKPNKMLMPVMPVFGRLRSTIDVFYFFRMLCRNCKILPMKKKTIILFMRKLR